MQDQHTKPKPESDLPIAYDPKSVESRIYGEWQKRGFFNSDKRQATSDKEESKSSPSTSSGTKANKLAKLKSYTILLPPPNITGSLHMGHALNATISDILIRYHRMKGYKTAWLPGIDHAGIAAQNVVEKNLRKENISRFDLGREKFIAKVWEWKEKYGNIILDQLKRLGASCDWSRVRFTMDPDYSEQVSKAFVHYYEKGVIYRGKRVVNWCPRCQTSLSDLEIEYKEEVGKLYFIKYPLVGRQATPQRGRAATGQASDKRQGNAESISSDIPRQSAVESPRLSAFVVVATTRPETMLGDAAIAVNPKDKRYKDLVGRTVLVPLTDSPRESASAILRESANREIPIVADIAVDEKFGTGMVKVTPAHDQLDSEIGARHKLSVYEVINERGRMQNVGPICDGLKTLECREKIVVELQTRGLLEKTEDLKHSLSVCYRCNTVLEPLLSNQWFMKMAELAKKTAAIVKTGKTKIVPKNFETPFLEWLKNIKDWCISRQIWWGHQLPVYFCKNVRGSEFGVGNSQNQTSEAIEHPTPNNFIVSLEKPTSCPFCKTCAMERSADVLDTWFSSALWPFAGLSDADQKQFYPSNVLITARDIINLWVGRMIFSGLEFMKKTPFKFALIHGTILTKDGKRMSKSLGTGIDPLLLIDQYGADATRFGIIWQAMGNQDIRWDEAAVMAGKKFANKIWNASRFVLGRATSDKRQATGKEIISPRAESRGNFEPTPYPRPHTLDPKTAADKKIIKELQQVKKRVERLILKYEFGQALHTAYDFFWHEFCDVYLEASKMQADENTNAILSHVLFESLKILHPFMPHLTEEVYQKLIIAAPMVDRAEKSWLIVAKW